MFLTKERVQQILKTNPSKVPIVVIKDKKLKYILKNGNAPEGVAKILAPRKITLFQLRLEIMRILKENNSDVTDAIFITNTVTGKMISGTSSIEIGDIVDEQGKDGALYLTLYTENAFG